jgi:hypothetical protein
MANVPDLQSVCRFFNALGTRGIYDEAADGRKSSARATDERDTRQLTHVTSASCMDPYFNPSADEQHTPRDVYDMGKDLPYVSGKKTNIDENLQMLTCGMELPTVYSK